MTIPAKSGIYKIVNTVSEKIYIGSAVNLQQRWRQHRSALNKGYHDNPKLQKSWNKHGADKFTFEVVEFVDEVVLLPPREQHWMEATNACDYLTGYNLCKVIGSRRGVKLSDEVKAKISAAKKGKKLNISDEMRAQMSALRKGKPRPPEVAEKMRGAHIGKKRTPEQCAEMSRVRMGVKRAPHSEETKAKISAAQKGRTLSDERKKQISESLRGKVPSEATRLKKAESMKAAWAKRRLEGTAWRL